MKLSRVASLRQYRSITSNHGYLCLRCAAQRGFQTSNVRRNGVQDKLGNRLRDLHDLRTNNERYYPRVRPSVKRTTLRSFKTRYESLGPSETRDGESVTVNGRIVSIRTAGSKLVFLHIVQDGERLQILANYRHLDVPLDGFRQRFASLYRGDNISVCGLPHRTERGELTVFASDLPLLQSPSVELLPTELTDPESRIRNRHVDLLVNRRASETLRLRSHIIQQMRNFFLDDEFTEVQTPILAGSAGGAAARPFSTSASEFQDKAVELRIAPELWLKRLVLGGFDRVFEIGPSFRNEGIDATHNPEFTTCEFYKSYADLEELIKTTEDLLSRLHTSTRQLKITKFDSLSAVDLDFTPPFKRISFVPSLEAALEEPLPILHSPSAQSELFQLFDKHRIPPPSDPTVPRLLDALSTEFLEPRLPADSPTFLTHHPEVLAPLAKSHFDPETGQRLSARVELFVQGREIINAYEEENSPFEQRSKFEAQLGHMQEGKSGSQKGEAQVDENYLQALEWGLPPTGGWGCGVDRLVMLFSGAKRISDVLPFGTLRNVVGLNSSHTERQKSEWEEHS